MGKNKKLKFVNIWIELENGNLVQISDLPLADYERFLDDMCRAKTDYVEMAREHLKKHKI